MFLLLSACSPVPHLSETQKEYARAYRGAAVRVVPSIDGVRGPSQVGLVFRDLVPASEVSRALGNGRVRVLGFGYYAHSFGGYHPVSPEASFDDAYGGLAAHLITVGDDVKSGLRAFYNDNADIRGRLRGSLSLRESTYSRVRNATLARQFAGTLTGNGPIIYAVVVEANAADLNAVSRALPVDVVLEAPLGTRWSLVAPPFVRQARLEVAEQTQREAWSKSADEIVRELLSIVAVP